MLFSGSFFYKFECNYWFIILTMFKLVNKLLIVIQLQLIHFVYQTFNISHTCVKTFTLYSIFSLKMLFRFLFFSLTNIFSVYLLIFNSETEHLLKHTQKFTNKRLRFERLKVINMLSSSNENDRTLGGCHTVDVKTNGC